MLEFKEIHVLDKNAEALGIPTATLMENAGRGVADFIKTRLMGSPEFKAKKPKLVFFCGPGNNGGDGFVAARYLEKDAEITMVLTTDKAGLRTELSKMNFEKIKDRFKIITKPKPDHAKNLLDSSDIIIDAILGIGISGELREPYTTYVKLLNSSGKTIVSVDAPTGLGTASSVKPGYTVTFHDIKVGMAEENSGEIVVVPIGIPDDAVRFIGPGELVVHYPPPAKNSHKGQNGRLLIVGGGPYTGAPALTAMAALRTGADLVHLAVPSKIKDIVAGYSPNFIVHELDGSGGYFIGTEDKKKVVRLAGMCDACVLGPGIGREAATLEFVKSVFPQMEIPVVVDADGLNAITTDVAEPARRPKKGWVLTPHYNELRRLCKNVMDSDLPADKPEGDELMEPVRSLSVMLGAAIAVKGEIDIVCAGKLLKYNRTGNPGMTTGGTGDVLTGIIGALVSKGVMPYNAARLGVFISGSAGDLVWQKKGPALTATDVVEAIPEVLMKYIEF